MSSLFLVAVVFAVIATAMSGPAAVTPQACKIENDCGNKFPACRAAHGNDSFPTCVNGTCVCVWRPCVINCTRPCFAKCKGYDACRKACLPAGTSITTIPCKVAPAPWDHCEKANCPQILGNADGCIGGFCACVPVLCNIKCGRDVCDCWEPCHPGCLVNGRPDPI